MKRFSRCLLTLALVASSPAGASAKPTKPTYPAGQYKRMHQDALRDIVAGRLEEAVSQLKTFQASQPNDPETCYMLAVAHLKLGQTDEAQQDIQQALELGLPPGRIIGGTLTGLDAIQDTDLCRRLLREFKHKPVHGPMLGCATADSIKVWVRTAGDADVQVIASQSKGADIAIRSPVIRTRKETDYTAEVPVTGLKPKTTYHYSVLINGKSGDDSEETHTFHTPPAKGEKCTFRIAFGGGAGYVPQHERQWKTIRSQQIDALILLGDNVYIDDPEIPQIQHYTYYRRQSRPEYRDLTATTPVYAIWDDHDFGLNDCAGGPKVNEPAWKPAVWHVFCNNWVNPYEGTPTWPGCNFDFHIGNVHFIMLECRYYRTTREHTDGTTTMLGPRQKRWLLDTLESSKGMFKVICSSVPWTFLAKGDSLDTWNGFREERKEIFDFLTHRGIDGVVLLSADRHRSDLWKIDRDNDYPLYEFNTSRLTNQHKHEVMSAAEFSYNAKQSFGLVDFDTTVDDPMVTYRIVTIDNETVLTFPLKLNQLRCHK